MSTIEGIRVRYVNLWDVFLLKYGKLELDLGKLSLESGYLYASVFFLRLRKGY